MSRNAFPASWDYETDILIVGFGGAGACAAIAAADRGADVLIVEKQAEDGYYSNIRMSGGAFHSPRPDGNRDVLEANALAMFSGDNLPWKLEGKLPSAIASELAAAWAEYAPQNLAWMQDLDPEYSAVEERGAVFPEFPGADESAYRVLRSTYSGEINNKNRCQKDDPKSVTESCEAFYTCL
ncbi:FAD-dependent oxidoreductase [Natrialba asiatica]|uniref:FAD-dependent oxidoreductase n=1 Tax=Natrialba asiatica TaxID=64602 RepID=UPI000677E14A|nr:FAD-dependent oxidoreductase [Natrialba asiatica]